MVELRDYQIMAVQALRNGSILCGGVGSGKSMTSIAYYYIQQGGEIVGGTIRSKMVHPKDLYIITTARKRDTAEWEGELAKFAISTHENKYGYSNKVVVDSWNNIGKYRDIKNAFFIFDEQRVVGSGAWTKHFIAITRNNSWILLSATPGDTWTDYIPVFIANGFYENRTQFMRQHAIVNRFAGYPKIERYVNEGKLIKYRNAILVNMDYLKPTTQHHMDIMTDYDKSMYKMVTKNRWDPFEDQPIENASRFCSVLRRIVSMDISRQVACRDLVRERHRAIVFYMYDYELDILRELPYGEDVEIAEWNGHKHEPIPDSAKWVYLVQYNSGAEGWNCISTDSLIFYSQSYSYKQMVQAAGRIDRMNTPYKDLYYYHLKSTAPIDIAVDTALKHKKDFNEKRFIGGVKR